MSSVCKFLSVAAVLAAVSGLTGCYDLSAPDGPRREDFLRAPPSAAPAEQASGACGDQEPCVGGTSTPIVRESLQPIPVQIKRAYERLSDATSPTGGGRTP